MGIFKKIIHLLLAYLTPPVLFIILYGIIIWIAFNQETKAGFWIWVLCAYFLLIGFLIFEYHWIKKKAEEFVDSIERFFKGN